MRRLPNYSRTIEIVDAQFSTSTIKRDDNLDFVLTASLVICAIVATSALVMLLAPSAVIVGACAFAVGRFFRSN
jgi:hypothetical protein